ncbi:uncharacterized protein [Choristoneura fumiferana]|uniref:uncharacterized protein n=1 Tax=Choristoneura fumiferana TaxID=7141 RepID=UPI003D15EDBF
MRRKEARFMKVFKNTNNNKVRQRAEAERIRLLKKSGVLDDYIARSRKDFVSGVTINNIAIKNLQVLNKKISNIRQDKFNEHLKSIPSVKEKDNTDDVIIIENNADLVETIELDLEPSKSLDIKDWEQAKIKHLKQHSDEKLNSTGTKKSIPGIKEMKKLCHINVNIISANINIVLTQEQCMLIKNEVEKQLSKFIEDPNNNLTPVFEHCAEIIEQGVTLSCYDEFSYDWLVKTVASITDLWEGCALKVVEAAAMILPMPVGTVVIPDPQGTIDDIKAHLDRMNSRWFDMSRWSVVSHRFKQNEQEKSMIVELSLPHSELGALFERDFKICYKLGVIQMVMTLDQE